MSTMTASLPEERTNQTAIRQTAKSARKARPAGGEEALSGARFFLPKSGGTGHAPELGREFSSEGEVRVEALKLGVTYYSLQEWRPVADFTRTNPELKREPVPKKGTG